MSRTTSEGAWSDESLARAVVPTAVEVAGSTEAYLRERFAGAKDGIRTSIGRSSVPRIIGTAVGFASRALSDESDRVEANLTGLDSLAMTAWTGILESASTTCDREEMATRVVLAALRVRARILDDWPTDFERGEPLDGRAYACFFGRSLVPGWGLRYALRDTDAKHIVVLVSGRAFRVEVTCDGRVLPPARLLASLRRCVALVEETPQAPCVATASPPAELTLAYQRLCTDQANLSSLRTMSEALFVLCLDEEEPDSDIRCGFAAHAGAPQNRWYMHALQLVVFRNCKLAVVGAFVAGLDGQPAMRVLETLAASVRELDVPPSDASTAGSVIPLSWSVPPTALDRAAAHCADSFRYRPDDVLHVGFGRRSAAALGLSTGCAFHLLLRAALLQRFGHMPEGSILQAVSRRHLEGTPLTLQRISSPTYDEFARALLSGSPQRRMKEHALRAQTAYNASVQDAKNVRTHTEIHRGATAPLLEQPWARPIRWAARCIPRERELMRLSLLNLPPGVDLVGRFGVFAAVPTSLWGHPFIGAEDLRLVLIPGRTPAIDIGQLGPPLQHVARIWNDASRA